MDNENIDQGKWFVAWPKVLLNLIVMIIIYATSAGFVILVLYGLARGLGLIDV